MDERHYILAPAYSLRGWKLLPYAVQNLYYPQTEFFREHEWELFRACDGNTDIIWDSLSKDDRDKYIKWEKGGFIISCRKGIKLRPEQEYRFYNARFKESVQWSITGKCNYKCRHCFMSAPHAAQGEPTWDELMTMLDAFERCGIKGLNLTGGEPMVRADFWNLVDEILARGMVIPNLYSNGLLITDKFLDELQKRHIRPAFQFSFDGVGYHDWMRGIKGAEKIVIDAMKRCRDRGYLFGVSMVLFKESAGSIRESVNLMSELGASYIKIGNASPQGEWLNQPEHYLTQKECYEAFLDYIPHYFEDGKPLTLGLEGFFNYDVKRDKLGAFQEKNIKETDFGRVLMCGHVRREMYVSPKGNVLPCMSMVGGPIEEKFPNMLEIPLEDILDKDSLYMNIINFRIKDFMDHNPECRTCKYRMECCGGCRAMAVREGSSDYLAKDLVTCEYYKGGWKDKKDILLKSIH